MAEKKLNTNLLVSSPDVDYGSIESYKLLDEGKEKDKIVTISYPNRDDMQNKTSNFTTFMHITRGNIGTGLLALPRVCLSAGLWVGTIGIFVIGLLCVYCMHLLVKSSHALCARTGSASLDYGEVMEEALLARPSKLNKLSKYAKAMVNIFVVITQFGFCSVFIVFISSNLKYVIHKVWQTDPDVRLYMLVVIVILIPCVLIKHLKLLVYFSVIGNVIYLASFVIILQYVVQDLPDVSNRPAFNSTKYLPLFLGGVFYTFEGIGQLLPIENKMATPEDLIGWAGVLNLAMVSATCVYSATGFYGYLKFGQNIQPSITLNLPNNWLYLSVNIAFAVVITFSYAIVQYVTHTILWPLLKDKISFKGHVNIAENLFRIFLLLVAGTIAMVVPHLDLLMSFMGALASSFLAVIFPSIIDILVRLAEKRLTVPIIILDSLLLAIGLIAFSTGSFVSLAEIIKTF